MENWITRLVAALFALGSTALFWVFGVFVVVPWRAGRLLKLSAAELQVIGVSLLAGIAVAWAAMHLFALADRERNPRLYLAIRIIVVGISLAAVFGGVFWTQSRIT